jgi:hypothetical protein
MTWFLCFFIENHDKNLYFLLFSCFGCAWISWFLEFFYSKSIKSTHHLGRIFKALENSIWGMVHKYVPTKNRASPWRNQRTAPHWRSQRSLDYSVWWGNPPSTVTNFDQFWSNFVTVNLPYLLCFPSNPAKTRCLCAMQWGTRVLQLGGMGVSTATVTW